MAFGNRLINTGATLGDVYLSSNGVTVIAGDNAVTGTEYDLNGTSYLVVDNSTFPTYKYSRPSTIVMTRVTSLYFTYFNPGASFNPNISSWDVSSVTNMQYFTNDATGFNQDLSNWDVSSVSDFSYMFATANSFTSDLSGWDVSSGTNMQNFFFECWAFNSNLSGWCVSNFTNAYYYQNYDRETYAWTLPKPVWGTCP